MGKYLYLYMALALILLVGCSPKGEQTTGGDSAKPAIPAEPSMEGLAEAATSDTPAAEETKTEMAADIKALLGKGKTKLNSYSYNYDDPGIGIPYKISVKGSKIRIEYIQLSYVKKAGFYNAAYLDTEKKTAEAYCEGNFECDGTPGKVKDLVYNEVYIETPMDWLAKVTEAEKIDEVTIESRECFRLQTNIGKIAVEEYYGWLYSIEDGKNKLYFSDAAFNSVSDSDVTP